MVFLSEEKQFCDLSLATRLALEQASVVNDLKGTKESRNKTDLKSNSSAIKQSSSSSSRKKYNLSSLPLSSAGTQPHPGERQELHAEPPSGQNLTNDCCC